MSVAFDKIGAGASTATSWRATRAQQMRDQPMLEEMTQAALASLEAHSPKGFYLMVEGASIDKQEHWVDGERAIWDAIEFDRAVAVALDFARRTNSDANPANDTLVIVTADHETGGLALIGVGNERYAPKALGQAVRDYAAVFRFEPDQAMLDFFPNYQRDARGYPADPDPTRKLLLGWAAAPDHYENWLANRRLGGACRQRRDVRGGRQPRRRAQARHRQPGARRQPGPERQRRPPRAGDSSSRAASKTAPRDVPVDSARPTATPRPRPSPSAATRPRTSRSAWAPARSPSPAPTTTRTSSEDSRRPIGTAMALAHRRRQSRVFWEDAVRGGSLVGAGDRESAVADG